jgi:DNA invertase Pin-like site-specific DNA recombinase
VPQKIVISEAKNGLNIVKTYIDDGKSGLREDGRDGLRSLISDIHSGAAEYNIVLMRDLSRWGRKLNDPAHYELICHRAGIEVLYSR